MLALGAAPMPRASFSRTKRNGVRFLHPERSLNAKLHKVFCLLVCVASDFLRAASAVGDGRQFSRGGKEAALKASDITAKLFPERVFFRGQNAPVQFRNSGGVRFADDFYVLAAIVDNSGYSTGLREKYQAYLLNEVTLQIGGQTLKPGAYGFGFQEGGKFLIMDIGANDVLNAASQRDTELKRPVPLQVVASSTGGSYRLYAGRDYIEFRRAQ
jgi:hypothetical protein